MFVSVPRHRVLCRLGTLLGSTNFRDRQIDFHRKKTSQKGKKVTKFIPDPYPILLFSRRDPQNGFKVVFENVFKILISIFVWGVSSPTWPPPPPTPNLLSLHGPSPYTPLGPRRPLNLILVSEVLPRSLQPGNGNNPRWTISYRC